MLTMTNLQLMVQLNSWQTELESIDKDGKTDHLFQVGNFSGKQILNARPLRIMKKTPKLLEVIRHVCCHSSFARPKTQATFSIMLIVQMSFYSMCKEQVFWVIVQNVNCSWTKHGFRTKRICVHEQFTLYAKIILKPQLHESENPNHGIQTARLAIDVLQKIEMAFTLNIPMIKIHDEWQVPHYNKQRLKSDSQVIQLNECYWSPSHWYIILGMDTKWSRASERSWRKPASGKQTVNHGLEFNNCKH